MYLWAIYIFLWSVCLFCCRKICGLIQILGIYKSLLDRHMKVEIGTAQFIFWKYIKGVFVAVQYTIIRLRFPYSFTRTLVNNCTDISKPNQSRFTGNAEYFFAYFPVYFLGNYFLNITYPSGGNTGWACWVRCCGSGGPPATCRNPPGNGNWAETLVTTALTSPTGSPSCKWPSSSYHFSCTGSGLSGWTSTRNPAWWVLTTPKTNE